MLRNSSSLPVLGRVLLAFSLCVLTVAFALEAKTAWYSPSWAFGSDISSAKAMPADTPASAMQRIHVDHSVPTGPELEWLAAFSAILMTATSVMAAAGASETRKLAWNPFAVSSRPHFSPVLFFRPPPSSL